MDRRKIAFVGIGCLAAAATTFGLAMQAHAAGATKSARHVPAVAQTAVEATTPDTDNVQQGDQTTPDTATVVHHQAAPTAVKAPSAAADEAANEEAASEASGESGDSVADGPGGHADPPGDVQHEGGPNEQ